MTQSFFVRNPNSFSWFEPDKLQASHAEGKADWSTLMVGKQHSQLENEWFLLFLFTIKISLFICHATFVTQINLN